MNENETKKKLLSRENITKIVLMIFGLSFFPAVIYFILKIFSSTPEGISGYYSHFYKSLLDMGMDGFTAWMIACGPYMVYEIYLLFKPR